MKFNPLFIPVATIILACLLILFSTVLKSYGLFLMLGLTLQAALSIYAILHFRRR